jgi:hypothetical protein
VDPMRVSGQINPDSRRDMSMWSDSSPSSNGIFR